MQVNPLDESKKLPPNKNLNNKSNRLSKTLSWELIDENFENSSHAVELPIGSSPHSQRINSPISKNDSKKDPNLVPQKKGFLNLQLGILFLIVLLAYGFKDPLKSIFMFLANRVQQ